MDTCPAVAIIVLNWNGFDDTVECLNSLSKNTYQNAQVVLVDNGSENKEGERLKELFPHIHLICNTTNRGFAGGNNDGINWALQKGYDFIVNLNNDCLVEPEWLSKLVLGLQSANADFASSRIMYFPETDLICSDGDVVLPDGSGRSKNQFKSFDNNLDNKIIFSACGAASIYSAECLKATNLNNNQFFDELYFAYFEDIDLGIRLCAKAFSGICVPEAVVYHKGSQSAGTRSYFTLFHLEKNRILNEVLNYPIWLIPIGESYYFAKTFLRRVTGTITKKEAKRSVLEKQGKVSEFKVILDSRKWLLRNIVTVWSMRRMRKAKGMVNNKILKQLYWQGIMTR